MLPNENSLLIDGGIIANVDSATDQRGFFRIVNNTIDTGAVQTGSRPICYSGDAIVLAQNINTGHIADIQVRDIYAGVHRVFDLKRRKFVPVVYNIVTGPINRFMKIAKNAFTENEPSSDFLVTSGHKILVGDQIVKARDIPQAIRVKTKPEMVYSICTPGKSILFINGLRVLSWGEDEWKSYSQKNGINWMDNKMVSKWNKILDP